MKRRAQPWLGTLVEVTIADALNDVDSARAFDAAFSAIATVHQLMSFHDAESDVSRINRMAVGGEIVVHAHTAMVLRMALQLQVMSDGLFDICCADKLMEWGYLPDINADACSQIQRDRPPLPPMGEGELTAEVENVSCSLSIKSNQHIHKNFQALIDLGGIAKGYAVDLAIEALQALGITSACVNAGGDLRVFGESAYSIIIRNPHSPTEVGRHIQLQNAALATSGSYFSQKIVDGEARSALLNHQQGSAIVNSRSVSVQASNCMMADALTKVVLSSRDAHHAILQQFGATAFII